MNIVFTRYYRFCFKLCGLFCRDLPFGNSEYTGWTERGGRGTRLQQGRDIFQDYIPSDGKKNNAACYKRGHHACKRYIACICSCIYRDVYCCEAGTSSMASVMPLFVAGLFYYIFNFIVAYAMEMIEKKLDYYR